MEITCYPPETNAYYERGVVHRLPPQMLFVFGSNLSGFHGAGAALDAKRYFGAIQHKGIGHYGQSYAIPTKDNRIQTLPLKEIKKYINNFVQFTLDEDNKHLSFFVTEVGCGLAGYHARSIAPFFKGAKRCFFPKSWIRYL